MPEHSEHTEAQHWPAERMINEGHPEYATVEDLSELDDLDLLKIAEICEVDVFAPDECIACQAHVMWLERLEKANNREVPAEESPEAYFETNAYDPNLGDAGEMEPPVEATVKDITDVPAVERFAAQVRVLSILVEELLEGPPIPPRNVSEEELALLVVAAQRWIRITEAQGVELAPSQQAILDATRALITRLHRGD